MIRHICDKCGNSYPKEKALFRIVVVTPGGLEPVEDSSCGIQTSKLDLCEDCKNRIMREANTPDPRKAEP